MGIAILRIIVFDLVLALGVDNANQRIEFRLKLVSGQRDRESLAGLGLERVAIGLILPGDTTADAARHRD